MDLPQAQFSVICYPRLVVAWNEKFLERIYVPEHLESTTTDSMAPEVQVM